MTAHRKKLSELTTEDVDRMVAEKEAEAEAEATARRERLERHTALAAWRSEGGDEESFNKAWPQLRDESRRRRVMEQTGRAEAAARSRLRQSL